MTYNNHNNNQLATIGINNPLSFSYDAAGNLTYDPSNLPAHTYQWDAEGRVSTVDPGSNPTWSFTYNALGHRVQWAYTGGADQHLFDPEGNWLGVAGSYSLVRFGSRHMLAYLSSDTVFNHVNQLDATTMGTNHSGTTVEDVLFYPWGDQWQSSASGYSWTMPYYDTKTNTSFTTFRVYSQNLGRWLSPDPLGSDITNPQSLNRYPYVLNNPTTLTDPLGLQGCPPGTTSIGPGQCAGQAVGPQAVLWGLDEFGLMDIPLLEAEWVSPSQVDMTINGVDYPGPVVPGYWAWATIGTGIVFTQTGPTTATFVSTYPFYQTVGKFVQAGFHAAPFDLLNRFHPGQLDLRDNSLICSPHVAINKNSGGAPGVPTTGDIHLDTVNPYPSWSVAFGPGGLL